MTYRYYRVAFWCIKYRVVVSFKSNALQVRANIQSSGANSLFVPASAQKRTKRCTIAKKREWERERMREWEKESKTNFIPLNCLGSSRMLYRELLPSFTTAPLRIIFYIEKHWRYYFVRRENYSQWLCEGEEKRMKEVYHIYMTFWEIILKEIKCLTLYRLFLKTKWK